MRTAGFNLSRLPRSSAHPYVAGTALLLMVLFPSGCVTKAKSREQARAAFMAGQQSAMARMAQPQKPVVTLIGQVQTPSIPWVEGLTLARAIINAGYFGKDPKQIMIIRNSQAVPVDPKDLLNGQDIPLQAGDLIQIMQ